MDFFTTIRTNLRRHILSGYPSVEKFAHENSLDKTTLSRILNGKREPRLSTMIRIAQSLNLTLNDLYLDPDGRDHENRRVRSSAPDRNPEREPVSNR